MASGACCGTLARRSVSRREQLRLEYRLLGKIRSKFPQKIIAGDLPAGVAVRSLPPNCKMDACM
ncbi:hypothetical protein IQ252_20650 [Tychonema sp. LEGE 07203]|nr:hypothetical protein [Tychonema sp. LEGE 07203]